MIGLLRRRALALAAASGSVALMTGCAGSISATSESSGSSVLEAAPKPPRTAGEKIADEADGGTKIAEYLVAQKII